MCLPPSPDPRWLELIEDGDVDAVWQEWQRRLDRFADFTPASDLPSSGCVSPSPSAAGLLLSPLAVPPRPSKEAA